MVGSGSGGTAVGATGAAGSSSVTTSSGTVSMACCCSETSSTSGSCSGSCIFTGATGAAVVGSGSGGTAVGAGGGAGSSSVTTSSGTVSMACCCSETSSTSGSCSGSFTGSCTTSCTALRHRSGRGWLGFWRCSRWSHGSCGYHGGRGGLFSLPGVRQGRRRRHRGDTGRLKFDHGHGFHGCHSNNFGWYEFLRRCQRCHRQVAVGDHERRPLARHFSAQRPDAVYEVSIRCGGRQVCPGGGAGVGVARQNFHDANPCSAHAAPGFHNRLRFSVAGRCFPAQHNAVFADLNAQTTGGCGLVTVLRQGSKAQGQHGGKKRQHSDKRCSWPAGPFIRRRVHIGTPWSQGSPLREFSP